MSAVVEFPKSGATMTGPERLALRARTGTGVNWVGAFLLYAKGATLQEVSDQMGIPLPKLKNKWRAEDWDGLVRMQSQLAIAAPPPEKSAVAVVDADKRIQANREQAIGIAQGLRAHIQSILDAYREQKIFLPPADIAILAKAARDIDQAAMTALGDDPAPRFQPPPVDPNAKPGKNERPIQHFHINMPAVARFPRVARRVREEGAAVEVVPARGEQRDPILDPSPPRREMKVEPVESEVVEGVGNLASVDFSKLSKIAKAEVPATEAKPAVIPDFAKG